MNKMDKYHKEEKNWCDICYEPINEMKRVCGMCADNRVADGIWTEEEKNEKMYKENKMNKIHLEWNCNCKNDDYHEVRCEHFKLNNGNYKAVYECEECDYYYIEVTDYPNMIQNGDIIDE